MIELVFASVMSFTAIPPASHASVYSCVSPAGYAFFPMDGMPRWQPDGMSDGVIELILDDERFNDIRVGYGKPIKSLRNEGATVAQIFSDARQGFAALIVVYPNEGILDTYAVSKTGTGLQLLWTSTRDGRMSGQSSKVGSYSAPCRKLR